MRKKWPKIYIFVLRASCLLLTSIGIFQLCDIGDDCTGFLFAHDCELIEKQIWTKEFLILLRAEIDKRLK
jgi:hypothetical protein